MKKQLTVRQIKEMIKQEVDKLLLESQIDLILRDEYQKEDSVEELDQLLEELER